MKLSKTLIMMLATVISCSTLFAQDDDVVILNQDGEQVGIEQVKEVRKDTGLEGKRSVKLEGGMVIVIDEDGNQQTFDLGEARSVMMNRSVQIVDDNGKREAKSVGKVTFVGPDGVRREFEFDGGEMPGMMVGGMVAPRIVRPGAGQAEPAEKSYMVGINCAPVSDLLQEHLQLEPNTGLVVQQVTPEGPADKAGVLVNDILMFADDQQLSNTSDLKAATDRAGKDNGVISLTLIRAGEETNVEVTPTERKGFAVPAMRRGIPGMVAPRIEIFEDMPRMEFRDMGPGVFIGPDFDDPGFERMNERIKALQERVEKMHQQMLDDGR